MKSEERIERNILKASESRSDGSFGFFTFYSYLIIPLVFRFVRHSYLASFLCWILFLLVFLVMLFPRSRSSSMRFILVFTMLLDLLKFNFTSLTSYVIVLFNRIDIQFRLLLTFTIIIWQYHTTLQLTSLYLDINFTSLFHLITVK